MSVYIVVWCNGNTTDFGSVFQGSNPCATTYGDYSLMVGRMLVAHYVRVRFSLVTQNWNIAQTVRALDSYPRGWRFDSSRRHS